jgi:glycosyltransferase involved in cell wall biosynthesis
MGVYNGGIYLREAVNSIINQTYDNFEFIIIDDASTDDTNAVLDSFNDARIKIIKNESNLGLTRSLNKGLQLAQGKYIARMDADDISDRKRFERQVKFLEENTHIDLCGTWKSLVNDPQRISEYPVTHDEIKLALLSHNPFAHPSVMWRKDVFDKLGLSYNEEYVTSQDYELWNRAVYRIQTANIPENLLFYREHELQITNFKQQHQSGNATKIKLKQLNFLDLKPNSSEELAHLCVFDGLFKKFSDAEYVKAADGWMLKIFKANKKYNIYNEQLLLQFWRSVFFGTGLFSYDLKIWNVLKSSWCLRLCHVPVKQQAKQFVKCLLRWKVN